MVYTTTKEDQLRDMMHNFADKHNLGVVVRRLISSDGKEITTISFYGDAFKTKIYPFKWDETSSLSEGAAYIFADVMTILGICENDTAHIPLDNPKIQDVIFNDPATIIKWADGTKTVVKSQDGDVYDPEKGLAMAIAKKALGNKGNYNNEINKWLSKYRVSPVPTSLLSELRECMLREIKRKADAAMMLQSGFRPEVKDVISDVNKSIEENKR